MKVPICTPAALRLLQEGSLCLSRMENAGVRVDVTKLDATTNDVDTRVKIIVDRMKRHEIYEQWRRHFGQNTNLDSHGQLAKVLFDIMGYESNTKTASGKRSTTADALEDLELPFVYDFQEVQHLKTKAKGTYLNGIRKAMVRHADGEWYCHCFFNLHTTATYRSSSNDFNFQNQPKRNPEMAKLVRPNFLPHPGHCIVEGDFSQLEVRIAACYHKDPVMMKYIKDPTTDMHRDTAMQLFKITPKEYEQFGGYYKKTIRDSTKNQFVFPQFYGSTFTNCAKNIWKSMARRDYKYGGPEGIPIREHLAKHGIKELGDVASHWETDKKDAGKGGRTGRIESKKGTFADHCRSVEEDFWNKRFKVYTHWKKAWVEQYRARGWFKMLSGFVVGHGTYAKNDVINYPVQGSAFHCLLWCLIMIDKWLRKYKMESRLIGEIHDSLVASVHPDELQDFLSYCHYVMTEALPKAWPWINVPLDAEFDVTLPDADWYSAKEYHKTAGDVWALKA